MKKIIAFGIIIFLFVPLTGCDRNTSTDKNAESIEPSAPIVELQSDNGTIQVLLNRNLTITYRGEAQTMLDANGNQVFPISYDGITYLPVQAVSSMLGISIELDGSSNAVHIDSLYASPSYVPETESVEPPMTEVLSLTITYEGSVVTEFSEPMGSQVPLRVRIEPADAEFDDEIIWTSSDTSVAEVVKSDIDEISAIVTIVGAGTANSATLTVSKGDVMAECTVSVSR